ncbi:MAG: hypothetical protein RRZ24_09430 [Clostridia bacterium]
MSKQDFLETNEFSEQQILDMMNLGVTLKACVRADYYPPLLKKKCIAAILGDSEPSYRLMLETAVHQLSGHLSFCDLPLEPADTLRESAMQLSRSSNLIFAQCERHETMLLLAKYADIPVVNAGTNHSFPVQEIANLITMFEHLPPEKKLEECKVVYDGVASPLCSSVLFASTKIGMQFVQLCSDKGHELQPPTLKIAERNVKKSGGIYNITDSSPEAYHGAHFLFMDTPLNTKLPPDADGVLRVDPSENRIAAFRAVLTCMLYQNPAAREPILIEKMKRMLSVKLQAIFGFGEANE